MIKILTVKLLMLVSFFIFYPITSTPLFAQDDDNFDLDATDWSDEAIDDAVFDDIPAEKKDKNTKEEVKVKKNSRKKPAGDEELPDFDSFEEEKPAKAKKAPPAPAVAEPVKNVRKTAPVDNQPSSVSNAPEKPAVPLIPPAESKPKLEFEPIKPAQTEYNVGNVVKRAGPPLVLISRPVYAPYSNESKTMYISAAAEAYFHFKLGALPGVQMVSQERIANNVQYFRDFSRRISRKSYEEAAKKVGATYLFYQEYEPKGKNVKFATELFSIAENKRIAGTTNEISLSEFEDGLFDYVNDAAGALIGTIPQAIQEFLAEPVMGKNTRQAEALGNAIVSVGAYSQKNAEKAASEFEKLAKDQSMHLARYVAAQNFARAHMFDKAIDLQQKLIATFGTKYPYLSLQLASFYRMAGSYSEAMQAANDAGREPALALVARIEKARIYEAQGQLDQAKREYESVLAQGEDGEIYFQLALVSIGLNNLTQAQNYLEKAAAAGRPLDRGDYFDLGLRYEAVGTANEQAIAAFRSSLGLQQDNVDAWQKLAEIYSSSGREAEAAECYVSLFQIDNQTYKDYLVNAGKMFENTGYLENAKDAYALFLARKFDNPEVNVRFAKLEVQTGDCKKAIELVDEMDTTGEFGSDIIAINTQCGKQERRVVIPTGTERKGWRALFFWRVASGAVAAAGVGLGLYIDNLIQEKIPEYEKATMPADVDKAHSELKALETNRNICYLGVGVGITSFALSIALPIAFSSKK